MELLHLLQLVSELPQNSTLQYVRGTDQCKFVEVDIEGQRINSLASNGEYKSWAPSYLTDLAPKIIENVPFNLSGILNNKGSYRPILETIIAHTREFYIVRKGTATLLVWIPSKPKQNIGLSEIESSDIPSTHVHDNNVCTDMIIKTMPLKSNYNEAELADILNDLCEKCKKYKALSSAYHLFGLKYYKILDGSKYNISNILRIVGASENYIQEINKGVRLAKLIETQDFGVYFYDSIVSGSINELPNIENDKELNPYLAAMRTKPFLLLAGISGTGKSRIVKEMAFASCPPSLRGDDVTPGNYCMIEVKPNWHDSSELMGYESKIGGDHYVVTPFINFLIKALHNPKAPFFVCLDEMNLAPVEQYFAEFLSVLESRKLVNGEIVSEPLIKPEIFSKYYKDFKHNYFKQEELTPGGLVPEKYAELWKELGDKGLRLPSNVIVVGTVNMDETTYQFSRKVIDRAMTIEMNEVNFDHLFGDTPDTLRYRDPYIGAEYFLPKYSAAKDALSAMSDADRDYLKDNAPIKLRALDDALVNTPFRIAYRVENELILYFAALREEQPELSAEALFGIAVDDIMMMKVLPRIEGCEDVLTDPLNRLADYTRNSYPKAHAKVEEMQSRLKANHFTSFWP